MENGIIVPTPALLQGPSELVPSAACVFGVVLVLCSLLGMIHSAFIHVLTDGIGRLVALLQLTSHWFLLDP